MLLLGAIGSINCTHWEKGGRQSCQAFEVACSLKQWIFNDHPLLLLLLPLNAPLPLLWERQLLVRTTNQSGHLGRKNRLINKKRRGGDAAKYCLLAKVKLTY